jgi:DeoR/GlpR family transcriptional regulator of sugar metabolism
LRNVHLDLVVMGVHGMDEHSGFTSPNLLEAETDRTLVEAGRRLVVAADHTKWGVVGLSSIARLDQADVLITDGHLEPAAREILAGHVHELVEATPSGMSALPRAGGLVPAVGPPGLVTRG